MKQGHIEFIMGFIFALLLVFTFRKSCSTEKIIKQNNIVRDTITLKDTVVLKEYIYVYKFNVDTTSKIPKVVSKTPNKIDTIYINPNIDKALCPIDSLIDSIKTNIILHKELDVQVIKETTVVEKVINKPNIYFNIGYQLNNQLDYYTIVPGFTFKTKGGVMYSLQTRLPAFIKPTIKNTDIYLNVHIPLLKNR